MNKGDKRKQGKKNKASGADFERRVRKDLEEKGWIVAKWPNNLEYPKENINKPSDEREDFKCIPSKTKWIFTKQGPRPAGMGSGFPDFIAYKTDTIYHGLYEVIFVEAKIAGYLDRTEKEMAKWYLKNHYCNKFLTAYKTKVKNRIKVNYKEFQ